jgi:hypothetical protein
MPWANLRRLCEALRSLPKCLDVFAVFEEHLCFDRSADDLVLVEVTFRDPQGLVGDVAELQRSRGLAADHVDRVLIKYGGGLYAGERETMVDVTGGRLAKLGHPKRHDALDDLAEFVITQPSLKLRLAKEDHAEISLKTSTRHFKKIL